MKITPVISQVRSINILIWENCKFSTFFFIFQFPKETWIQKITPNIVCLSVPKRDLDKKITPSIEVCLESLEAMLEY